MKEIAIVGCGPRGLYSLECLMRSLSHKRDQPNIKVTIYEKENNLGSGQVWKLDQPDANWLNIADRALTDLNGREKITFHSFEIPEFPSFIKWMEDNHNHHLDEEVDSFPARNKMGGYLHQRFKTISDILISEGFLTLNHTLVKQVQYSNKQFVITDSSQKSSRYDECLLTIGHQPTEDDSQIESWKSNCNTNHKILFDNPYEKDIMDKVNAEDGVGLRGFGLAMIDMMRQLTTEKGAHFEKSSHPWKLSYRPSSSSVKKIIPFSLDGLPMVPKPLGKKVDSFFTPSPLEFETFKNKIYTHLQDAASLNNIEFLLDAFVPIAVNKYLGHPSSTISDKKVTIEIVAKEWLNDMSYQHELILNPKMNPKDYINQTVEMALGLNQVSLDFVIGQVWRHLQPTMYNLFSHSHLHDLVMAQVIALDESTKRYSYGPPVESMIQMLSLMEHDVIKTRFLSNPDIKCKEAHWLISKNDFTEECTVMINTVLNPPQLREINSTIVKNLLHNELLEPVTSDLGIATNKDGTIKLSHKNDQIHLAALGRNCKGSVMGVDAILECFGTRIENWSNAIVERL